MSLSAAAESAAYVHARAESMLHKHIARANPGEAAAVTVFLPGCKACGEKHPLAFTPRLKPDVCPRCGAAVLPPHEPELTRATLTGRDPSSVLARALLSAGAWFSRLTKRMEDGR
jgi:hypothetical protein